MSVSIRLAKIGKRNAHTFRIVTATTRSKRNGKFLDVIGFYNPSTTPIQYKLDEEKYTQWVKKGAIVTPAVQEIIAGKYTFKPYHPNKDKKEATAEQTQPEA
ncbi:30S ribosomal protein S16 [Patescibacteria group bacterium]|nr:30S ribosomal protein S16 [Patescibacteria group bacterium]